MVINKKRFASYVVSVYNKTADCPTDLARKEKMALPENVLIDLLDSARKTLKTSQAAGMNQDMFHTVTPQFYFDEEDVRSVVDYFRTHQVTANGVRLSAGNVVHNLLVFARSDDTIRPFIAQLHQGMTKGAVDIFI